MKTLQRVLALLVVLLCLSACAVAEDAITLKCQNVYVGEGKTLNAILYTSADEALKASDFSMRLDAQSVEPQELTGYQRSVLGTTWAFIIDTSTDDRLAQKKTLATNLLANLSDVDNAAIVPMNAGMQNIALKTDVTALEAQISALKETKGQSALYATMSTTLKFLQAYKETKSRVCLVVISDGENVNQEGMTRDELLKEIAASGATVYTYTVEKSKKANSKSYSLFSALARESCGGAEVLVESGAKDLSEAITRVASNEKRFFVLTATPAASGQTLAIGLKVKNFELSTQFTLSSEAQQLLAMGPGEGELISGFSEEQPPTSIVTVEPPPTPVPTWSPYPPSPENWYLYAGAGALLLVIIIIIIVAAVHKSHKAKVFVEDPVPSEHDSPNSGETEVDDTDKRGPTHLRVMLEPVGLNDGKRYQAEMVDSLIIGRDATRGARLVLADDHKISGVHCKLTYAEGAMYVADMSRNGTQINGVPLPKGEAGQPGVRTVLHQQDVLKLGSTSLRISWNKN
ncbi:MAG: FHA domain-containing protein [Eubacteriales bacterium]|nr:FHA domain-containing protein [Eubacteriales bacterium]